MKKYSLFMVSMFILILGCAKEDTINQDQIKGIIYYIEKVQDVSYGSVKRYDLRVVVSQKVDLKQLETISKVIIRDFKKKKSFNAISVGFYDYKEYLNDAYTLGYTEYAPKGDWSKANTIKTGNYSSMKYNFQLKNKDWNKRLTQDEVKIYDAWNRDLQNDTLSEDGILRKVAHDFNIDVKEVDRVVRKQSTWTW